MTCGDGVSFQTLADEVEIEAVDFEKAAAQALINHHRFAGAAAVLRKKAEEYKARMGVDSLTASP